jgi:hypothetical protein
MATDALFITGFFLIFFTANLMAYIASICIRRPADYVNQYKLLIREEHENYKRYERREYLDSLRSYKIKTYM